MKRFTTFSLVLLCLSLLLITSTSRASASGSLPTAGTVSTSVAKLNVRSGPSTSYGVVANLSRGSTVMLYGKSNGWWHIGLSGGKSGYCSASYINELSGSAARQVSVALNVRSGPSTSYAVQTVLYRGTVVVSLSTSGDFSRIIYDGIRIGYVRTSYLKSALESSASTDDTYAAISLNVPYYNQTDSRWASVELGTSGKTIGDIGCATTSLAMTESYRTGSTVTPDAMANRLTYNAAGALYWPENYALVDRITYAQVYAKLKSGVPVIVGCKNAAGGTHFVVIKGFAGGNSLTASGFLINDPGSRARTTLSQFLAAYPTLFRRVYNIN